MPSKDITETGDTTLMKVADSQVVQVTGVIIVNKSTAAATVILKDEYNYVDGTSGVNELLRVDVSAGGTFSVTNMKGQKVLGSLVVNTNQPIYITWGVSDEY